MLLLCITGLDDTENLEIYKTYMHFDQIVASYLYPAPRQIWG